jgi:pantetheine-phosphate adenylyltransferase
MSGKLAVYAFSGDPITIGHLDIIKRARQLFPRVLVAIGTNPDKTYTFSALEREQMAKQALKHLGGVRVAGFTGLLVDFAYEQGAVVIVKGVRDTTDFQYEQTLNSVGLSQNLGLETITLFARPELAHISSGTVKTLQKSQGLVHDYVPLSVKTALEKKLANQVLVGITGEIASGKTYLAEQLMKIGKQQGRRVHNLDLDQLAHQIQDKLSEPQYQAVRQQIIDEFGAGIQKKNGLINRKKLGELVFNNPEKLDKLNQIMWKPVLVRLRRELQGKEGVVLINSALLAEANLLAVCNNRIILTEVDEKTQKQRLKKRGLTASQIKRRLAGQFSANKKRQLIEESLQKHFFGTLWQVTDQADLTDFAKDLFTEVL